MKKLAMLLGLFVILLAPSAMAYQQDLYWFNSSSASSFNVWGAANVSASDPSYSCNSTVLAYYDINNSGSPYSYVFTLYINGTAVQTNSQSSTSARDCFPLFNYSLVGNSDFNATVGVSATGSPFPVNAFMEIHTSCYTNNSNAFITNNNTATTSGFNMYEAGGYISDVGNDFSAFWLAPHEPAHCTIAGMSSPYQFPVSVPLGYKRTFAVPFNSGFGSPIVVDFKMYNWTDGSSSNAYKFGYYDVTSNTTTIIGEIGQSGTGYVVNSTNLSLAQNQEYIAFISYACQGLGFCTTDGLVPDINITTPDIEPDYLCGAFGACVNGTRSRTCVDQNGFYPDEVQTTPCLLTNQTVYLGFEDSAPKDTSECVVGSTCFYGAVNITYNNPENPHWEILPNGLLIYAPNQTRGEVYGGTMTGSETFNTANGTITVSPIMQPWNRGSNFLKLWYQPPYYTHAFFEPNTSTFQCGNSTLGLQSIGSFDYVNGTFLASLNFTFPSSTMSMLVDVRKCPMPPVQYTPPFYCVLSGGQACYGNCSAEPKGNYFITVFDVTTSTIVLNYNDVSIKENWTTIQMDVSNVINQDHNYRVIVGVSPPSGWPFDVDPYCSYFDNLRLFNQEFSSLDVICLDLFGHLCATEEEVAQATAVFCTPPQECVGNDLYTKSLQNGVCVSKILSNEPTCVEQQQNQVVTGNQSIFLPINSIANTIVNTTTNQTLAQSLQVSGFGWILVFLTPIFWIMLLVIGVTIIGALLTKHMEIGVVVGILMLVAFALVLPELIWITIVLIVVAGIFLGREFVKIVSG